MARTTQGGKQIRDRTITKADLDATGETEEDILVVQSDGSVDFQNINSLADIKKLQDNILLNAFRIAINGGLVKYNMVDGIMDEFEDESGVDTATSTNEDYDSVNDLYEPTSSGGLPSAEYSVGDGIDEYTKLLLHANGGDATTKFYDSANGEDTVLMLHFDGVDEAVATTNAGTDIGVIGFNGNAQIDTAQKKFGESSLLLDGVGDYCRTENSSSFDFGSGDFTIGVWFRPSAIDQINELCSQRLDTAHAWSFHIDANNKLCWTSYSGSWEADYITTDAIPDFAVDTWFHLAITRTGANWYLFVDGVSLAVTKTVDLEAGAITAYAGGTGTGYGFFIGTGSFGVSAGHLDDFRIVKGTALWTANFTAPTVSPSPKLVTAVADAQIDTAQKVFGTGSALFDGTGDYLSIPDSDDWNFGNGNFTIDCWVRFADVTTSSMGICGQYVDSNNYWKIFYYKDITKLYFECKSASSYIPSYGVTWSPSVDTWYHIACVSDGTNVHFYVDGVEVGSGTAIGTIPELASVLEIGYASNEVRSIHFYMNGWIDEFRISKGIARWPSDFDVSVSDNMTLVSNSTEAEANPDNVRLVAFSEDVDAITLDTDLKFYASRDNGANWVQGTLSDEGDYNSGKRILTGEADVSGQASDKTMKWKIETLNNKDCKIRGLGLLWD